MELNKLLTRQLRRHNLNFDNLPSNPEDWQGFLKSIHNAYQDADQERYLLQRSVQISSSEMRELYEKGKQLARSAGMADVSTMILHNIGNVLNSTNTSVHLIEENISDPFYSRLIMVLELIKEHESELTHFLTQDHKGKLIPEYLITVKAALEKFHFQLSTEISNIQKQLQHLKEIIMRQQSFAKLTNLPEVVDIQGLINSAIDLSDVMSNKNIEVKRKYSAAPSVFIDKTKLLQILVNLIRNAKDSVFSNPENQKKEIEIGLEEKEGNKAAIYIKDNGIGINKENLVNIFAFGYSTKTTGHGFGLHNSAILSKEIGAELSAASEGINRGAVFTLILPINLQNENA